MDFFKELPDYSTELYTHKKMKTNDEIALSSLQAALPVLENLSDWNETAIHDSLMALVGELGIKNGQLLWPVRTALSGEQTSPAVQWSWRISSEKRRLCAESARGLRN